MANKDRTILDELQADPEPAVSLSDWVYDRLEERHQEFPYKRTTIVQAVALVIANIHAQGLTRIGPTRTRPFVHEVLKKEVHEVVEWVLDMAFDMVEDSEDERYRFRPEKLN